METSTRSTLPPDREDMRERRRKRTDLFRELAGTVYTLPFSVYSPEGTLLPGEGNSRRALDEIFARTSCRDYMVDFFRRGNRPLLMSTAPGLVWGAMAEDGEEGAIALLGPVLLHPIDTAVLSGYAKKLDVSLPLRQDFLALMQDMPVIGLVSFQNLLLMLSRALTDLTYARSDIAYQEAGMEADPLFRSPLAIRDRSHTYRAETALLDHIRNGDMNFQEDLTRASLLSEGPAVDTPDPLERTRLSCISFTTLAARAAIEGGLSPDAAYTLQDRYLQSLMLAKSTTDMVSAVNAMYSDFIGRVAALRASGASPLIRNVISHLLLHLEEPFSLAGTAAYFGYTAYYLSRRFKRETGLSVGAFLRRERLRRSAAYLSSTDLPVQEIAERLRFSSPSHYAAAFQEAYGMSPTKYRRQERHT